MKDVLIIIGLAIVYVIVLGIAIVRAPLMKDLDEIKKEEEDDRES